MGELKHGFGAAKMNKDADERTVPKGEYRNALNIQVVTSDGSDVGTMQTLLGNNKINPDSSFTADLSNAKCVGVVSDEKSNKLYYFIQDNVNYTDYILEYNSDLNEIKPIVVDKYRVVVEVTESSGLGPSSDINTSLIIGDLGSATGNITNVRPGMSIQGSFLLGGLFPGVITLHGMGLIVIRMEPPLMSSNTTTGWKVFMDETKDNVNLFELGFGTLQGQTIDFRAKRALNFKGTRITGINVVNGVIYWTDGSTEPKKIIIDNFLKDITKGVSGTHESGEVHSFFNVYDRGGGLIQDTGISTDFRKQPHYLKEEHITVIKKSPLHPPTLLLSNTSEGRLSSNGVSVLDSYIDTESFVDFDGENLPPGTIKNVVFNGNPSYVVGDQLLLRKSTAFTPQDLNNYEIIIEIIEMQVQAIEILAKVKIISIQTLATNALNSSDVIVPAKFFSTLQQEKPLYEMKFAKFAYRYKYQDNQYSPYSPFSEPAFLPGDFSYAPIDGYNLGMVNTLRSVYVMDFVPDHDTIPKDVIEVDILYKESNSTNVYNVKTIKYGEDEWIARGSDLNTGSFPARTSGRVHITSEMVRSSVASNQLLRPWDNVPRTALAQEVVGNRIVYANYKQNYNL